MDRTSPPPIVIAPADPAAPAVQAALAAYFADLDRRFPGGFDPGPPGGPAFDPAPYRAPGLFLLATRGAETCGCAGLVSDGPAGGEIKRLWVAPAARGHGLARRLMAAVEDAARARGWTRLRLDTHGSLTEARMLYARTGWTEIPRYNDNPHAQHWFERHLPPVVGAGTTR